MARATVALPNRNVGGKRNKSVRREIIIGPMAIRLVTITICAVLALVYLTQSTAGANRGMKIMDLETERGQLMLEKERLEVEQTRLKSLREIEAGIDKAALEPVAEVEHLKN